MATSPKVNVTIESKIVRKARPVCDVLEDLREMNRTATEDGEGPIRQIPDAIVTVERLLAKSLSAQAGLFDLRKQAANAADLIREQTRCANVLLACARDGRVGDDEGSPSVNDLRAQLRRSMAMCHPITRGQAIASASKANRVDIGPDTVCRIVDAADELRRKNVERLDNGGTVIVEAANALALTMIDRAIGAANAFQFKLNGRIDLLRDPEFCDLMASLEEARRAAGGGNA